MNDIILSGLLNLFALYNSRGDTNPALSGKMIADYLSYHFGLKNVDHSMALYRELLEVYDGTDEIDKPFIIKSLIETIKVNIKREERLLVALRIMEILSSTRNISQPEQEFMELADGFELGYTTYNDFLAFISEECLTDNVKSLPYGNGIIRLLYLQRYGTLVFSFRGEDKILYNDIPITASSFLIWEGSGVVSNSRMKPLYRYNAMSLFNSTDISSGQLKLRGSHINFTFAKGNGGIHDFSFNLYGGELVAIMGGSGTGKTTLLSILNGSIIPQKGKITINGHPISNPEVKTLIGFVPQDDLLVEELTVYQNLLYTARLCFDGIPESELHNKVVNLLRELGLDSVIHLKVGSPLNKYISGGQRKRLNIALELIREPNILFLDEPTSGLSSFDSMAVINLLREQTYKGKLVVTNIHQPSSDAFKMFDRLWIMDTGGYPIYDGNPIEALTYFKKAANTADDGTTVCPVCGNIDSETIFSIIDDKVIDHNGIITDKRKRSPQEWNAIYMDWNTNKTKDKIEALPKTTQQRPSILKQTWLFLKRNALTKFTDTQWLLITLLQAPVLALTCALLTHFAPIEGYTIMDNKNLVSYMFMAIIVATFLGMSGSAEEIIKDRALLKRERFLSLSYSSYICSKIIFLAGVALVQTFLFILVGNGIMGISCLFNKWWLIMFITYILASLSGLILSQWLKSVVAIYITIPILLIPQILLCGLVVHFPDLTPHSHTVNVPVIGDIVPSRWAFEALAVTSFKDNDYEVNFYDFEKEKYEAMYYQRAYLMEMKSQLETMHEKMRKGERYDDNMAVIKNSLPILLERTGLSTDYDGNCTYESLSDIFDKINNRFNNTIIHASDEVELQVRKMTEELGKDGVVKLKKDNYNLQLEKYVVNADTQRKTFLVDNHIVPRYGYIFLDPISKNGRAPFYSGVKIIGTFRIDTLHFNLMVMLLMCLVCTIILMINVPDRLNRNGR